MLPFLYFYLATELLTLILTIFAQNIPFEA